MKNQTTTTLVIGVLGLVAVIAMIGGIVLTLDDKTLPESIIAMGSLAVGAIAGILAKSGDTDDVRITNTPADPVPVTDDARGQSTLGIAVAALVIACVCLALILL